MEMPKCLFLVRRPPFQRLYRAVYSVFDEGVGAVQTVQPVREQI